MNQRGFSLVEVLISLVIFSFISLAIVKLQISNIRSGAEVRAMEAARTIASSELEGIYPWHEAPLEVGVEHQTINNNGKVFEVTTSVSKIDYRTSEVSSEIKWDDYGKQSSMSIITIQPTQLVKGVFVPFAELPMEITCEDDNKGHGNDFFNWDPDNPTAEKKEPEIGVEETCTIQRIN